MPGLIVYSYLPIVGRVLLGGAFTLTVYGTKQAP